MTRIVRSAARAAGGVLVASAVVLGSVASSAVGCARPAIRAPAVTFSFPSGAATVRDGWFLHVAAGDGPPHRVQIDTGSVGLAIAASAIPNGVPPGEAAGIHYSSSGKTLAGHIFRVVLTFFGNVGGARVRTATIPVLGVERVTCDRSAHPDCEVAPGEAMRVGVLGVGFGRHGSGADLADVLRLSERDVDPFLQIDAMRARAMPRVYTISARRIVLGDANATATHAWRTVTLARDGADWKALPGCFSIDDVAQPCAGGTVLVDTGVGTAIFATPARASGPVAPGTRLGIAIANAPTRAFSFTATRACADDALSCARWSHRTAYPTFVNTSRRLLRAVDYRFDDDCGSIAFRLSP